MGADCGDPGHGLRLTEAAGQTSPCACSTSARVPGPLHRTGTGSVGLRACIHHAVQRHLPYPIQLCAEPGRALVAEAGVLVATVIGTAERAGNSWLHLDIGAINGMMETLLTHFNGFTAPTTHCLP
jgi:hypothetical protein